MQQCQQHPGLHQQLLGFGVGFRVCGFIRFMGFMGFRGWDRDSDFREIPFMSAWLTKSSQTISESLQMLHKASSRSLWSLRGAGPGL